MRVNRSFTLLEIVISFSILTLIAALTGSVLFSVQQSWARIQTSTVALETRMRLDRLADGAFRNAVPFHWPDENRRDRQVFRGRPDFLRLAYRHRINTTQESGIRFLELELRDHQLIARYRRTPVTDEFPGVMREEVLASGVKSMQFYYAQRDGDIVLWTDEFDEVAARTIPLAIRMKLEFTGGDRIDYLRRTAGNSWSSTYGKYQATGK